MAEISIAEREAAKEVASVRDDFCVLPRALPAFLLHEDLGAETLRWVFVAEASLESIFGVGRLKIKSKRSEGMKQVAKLESSSFDPALRRHTKMGPVLTSLSDFG